MQCDGRMLKPAADHCPSSKSGLAAMAIQDKPPQPLCLMTSPLPLLQFLLATILQSKKGYHEETTSSEQGKDEDPKLQCLLYLCLAAPHTNTKLNLFPFQNPQVTHSALSPTWAFFSPKRIRTLTASASVLRRRFTSFSTSGDSIY